MELKIGDTFKNNKGDKLVIKYVSRDKVTYDKIPVKGKKYAGKNITRSAFNILLNNFLDN